MPACLRGKSLGSEEKCSSVFEFDHDDEDEDGAPAKFMEDENDECICHDPDLHSKERSFMLPRRRSGQCLCFKFGII